MTAPNRRASGPRRLALAAAGAVALVFVAANAHLVAVAFASRPDCVLIPQTEGAAAYRPAKTSC